MAAALIAALGQPLAGLLPAPSISQCSFCLAPLTEGGYEMQVRFLDKSNALVSARKFVFLQPKPVEVFSDELLDIHSQNGVCNADILKDLFSKADSQAAKRAMQMMKSQALKGATILVLDLKDPQSGYREGAQAAIAKCEKLVCDFLQSRVVDKGLSKHAKKVHELLPDFVLCEGSLKVDLLKNGGFLAAELDYFHTPAGAQILCQCTEFFMNAFKLGEVVQGEKGGFLAAKYIVPLSGKCAAFKPWGKSTVLYPALYKKVYALEGAFAKALSVVYGVSGKFDPATKITVMSVVKKS